MKLGVPLEVLCCPVTGQALRAATADEVAKSPEPLAEALIREDGRLLYPVKNGIPILLPTSGLQIVRD